MYRAYGGWTFAFDDYLALNITANLDSPLLEKMAAIIDPYGKKNRLKWVICIGLLRIYCIVVEPL